MAKEAIHMERNNVAQIVKQLTWSAVFVKLFFFLKKAPTCTLKMTINFYNKSKKKQLLTICRGQLRFAFQRNPQIYWLTT